MSRKGRKAFDNCAAAKVYPIRRVKRVSDNITLDSEKLGKGETYTHLGYHARLLCPKLEDLGRKELRTDDYLHHYQSEAVAGLRETAAAVLCERCEYSGMTNIEVIAYRAQIARAETEKLLAFKALEAARSELQKLENGEVI